MTKKELAQRINVDPKTIKNWETTKPELIKLINLGLEVEKHLGTMKQLNQANLDKTEAELLDLIHLGLATEEHIKETEEYLKKINPNRNI